MAQRLYYVRLIFLVAFLLMASETHGLYAQMPMGGPPPLAERSSPDEELKRLTKALKLTEQQRMKILSILKERSGALEALLGDQSVPMRESFPEIRELMDRSNGTIRRILTEPQQRKFTKMLADEERLRESGSDDGPPDEVPPPPPL